MNGYRIPGLDEAQEEIEAHKEIERRKVEEDKRIETLAQRRKDWAEFYGKLLPFVKAKLASHEHLMVTLNAEQAKHESEVLVVTDTTLKVGVGLGRWVDIKPIYRRSSSWKYRTQIGTMMSVGPYGQTTTFRQLKTGEWKWEEIAQALCMLAISDFNRVAAERRKASNAKGLNEWRTAHKLSEWGGFQASTNKELPVQVDLKVSKAMTLENAEKLLKALRELGVYVS